MECLLRPCKSLIVADLNDIAVFVRVAQFESFSRAAHALGMPGLRRQAELARRRCRRVAPSLPPAPSPCG